MKKPLLFIAFISLAASSAFAGGLLTNTNQSVHFLRNPARDASTEIDAVYTNPAGLTFLTDGLHLSFTNQSVYQTRTITSTFEPWTANNDGNGTDLKVFKGEAAAPIVPSFQLAYKKDNFVLSASAAITGGGGKAIFNHGLPSTEASISMLPKAYAILGVTKYSVNSYMEGRQYIFGLQMNGSYKFCNAFSGALGFRLNVVNNGYIGHLNDIKFNPGGGEMTTASPNKNLDCTQTGWGVTPIVSLNYHLSGLNLSAKYEFRSALNVQNNTKVDDTGLYPDGVNTPHDIPAYLALGAEYKICEKLKVSGGYHHFFDSDAKMAKDKQKFINGGINEFLLGSEYKINDVFLLSAGGQITRTGVTDAYQSDMSYSLNSYSIGFGGAMNITPDLRLNIAYFFTNYSDWTKTTTPTTATNGYNGTPYAGTDVYARTNKVFGIGLDYRF